jgi:hypothetical protein
MALFVIAIGIVLNETRVAISANRLADRVPIQELDALPDTWRQYQNFSRGSLGIGVISLERSLVEQTTRLTDRVIAKYREGVSTVWEPEWRMARDALAPAIAAAPGRDDLLASLRYCEGHLHRINGDARKKNGEIASAQLEFDRAVMAFREAAQARPRWPDPFLGLARTFISSLADVDRGADALSQAEGLGYKPGERETAQLAEGYRERGDTLVRSARQLMGMIQEKDPLIRAGEAYERALELYLKIPGWGDTTRRIRQTQRELERVQQRLNDIGAPATPSNVEPHDTGSATPPAARTLPL